MASKHICPKCGCTRFQVTAHVTQGWLVGETGDFIACSSECDEVLHSPDDDDIWTCDNCGTEAVIDNEETDPHRRDVFDLEYYKCPSCGTHTAKPAGELKDRLIRRCGNCGETVKMLTRKEWENKCREETLNG